MLVEGRFDNFAGNESLRLLGEVVAFDSDSLVCQPVKIRSEPGQGRIDIWSTHTRRTAHRGIENFNSRHEDVSLIRESTIGDNTGIKKGLRAFR